MNGSGLQNIASAQRRCCRNLWRQAVCLAVSVWIVAAAGDRLSAQPPQVVQMHAEGQDGQRDHGYSNGQSLGPLAESAEPGIKWPPFASDNPLFFAAKFGDAADNVYSIALDESRGTGTGYDVLLIDADNDNVIGAVSERYSFRYGSSSRRTPLRIPLQVTAGGVTSPYHVSFSAYSRRIRGQRKNEPSVLLRDTSYYVGEAEFSGKRHRFAILDLNSNGLFNDYEPTLFQGDRIVVDLNDDGRFANVADPHRNESFPYNRFVAIRGQWYSITPSADGNTVEVATADPPLTRVLASPHLRGARLRSASQQLDLVFENGEAEAIVGAYAVESLHLGSPKMHAAEWSLVATFKDDPPKVVAVKDEPLKLQFGPPLRVQPEVSATVHGRGIVIELRIVGQKGEAYRHLDREHRFASPGVLVIDESQRPVALWHPYGERGIMNVARPWPVPKSFDGTYQIWPVIDLPGLEYETFGEEVEFRDGKLVEPE